MNLSILLSILCAIAWGIQSIFLKVAMRDIPLFAAILIALIINFLAVVFLICIGAGGLSEFYSISVSIYLYFMLAGFLNYLLGRGLYYSSFRMLFSSPFLQAFLTQLQFSLSFRRCPLERLQ